MGLDERSDLDRDLAEEVRDWRRRGLGRSLEAAPGEGLVDFTSNDYLGLARHPAVCGAAARAAMEHGGGGRAARLLGGGSVETAEVERRVARWMGAEAALLLPSGYQANLTLLSALAGPGDVVVSDELNHASIIDGLRLSRARVKVFRHGDAAHAAELLREARGARRRFCVTDAVFSMGGDLAPLAALAAACEAHDAGLIVDEAHAAGVIGPSGRGGFAASGAPVASLVARLVTGSKALGAGGAFIVGSRAVVEAVLHRGRGFMFSTAVPPAVVGALGASVELAAAADEERALLRGHAARVAAAVGAPAPDAAIVPVPVGDEDRALATSASLLERGLDARAVRHPTVPRGRAQIRVACHATHRAEDVDRLIDALAPLRDGAEAPAPAEARARAEARADEPRAAEPVFIVGTDTDVGKTVAAAVVARALGARYWKPVQTGDDSDSRTVERLAGPLGDLERVVAPPAYEFPLPASPHTAAAAAGAVIDPEVVHAGLAARLEDAGEDPLVVELAGGLHVPITPTFTQADWLARVLPRVVLVARSALGTLNHTLLTLEALRARRMRPAALLLVGPRHPENAATLAEHVPRLFELPMLEPLDTSSIDRWLAEHPIADAILGE